jgi:hypothetical protein
MSAAPRIDPSATIRDALLGAWTAVGARTSIAESLLGDYSYVVSDCSVIYRLDYNRSAATSRSSEGRPDEPTGICAETVRGRFAA